MNTKNYCQTGYLLEYSHFRCQTLETKNKILSLSEGIYLHPVSILDDRELSTNCIHVTQDNMDILYDTLPENIFFICY